MRTAVDLKTGKLSAVFQPETLPKVAAIRFEGNQAIASEILTQTIGRLTVGQDFSERQFGDIVKLNLTPLYEEKGLLTVAFPPVKSTPGADGSMSVDIPIQEGRTWTLGKVDVSGDALPADDMLKAAHFPTGKLANWKEVSTGIAEMEKVLRRQGYLQVASGQKRTLHDDTGVVDLAVAVRKGTQSLFGSLQVIGLDSENQGKAESAWRLKPGDPLDFYYAYQDYTKSLRLTGPPKQLRVDLRPRAGTNIVDVAVTFK